MTELSKKILSDFQVRKTKKQKTAFIERMQAEYPEMKIEEGGPLKSRNLVVGDPEKARVVFGAHYDTCAVMPFPNFIMPKNILLTLLYSILVAVPFIALMVLTEILLMNLTDNFVFSYWTALIVFFASYFGILLGGPANKHTVNDNTSGVIMLIEMMASCKEKGIADVAFVFFDHEELGLLGSAFFKKSHKAAMKNKLLINFDCVSDGDHMLFVLSKHAMEPYEEAIRAALPASDIKTAHVEHASRTFYPSDQQNFPVSIGVAALKKKKFLGLYMDLIHTKKDTVMDERNIAYLCGTMEAFLAPRGENT